MSWQDETGCKDTDTEIFFPSPKDWMGERNAKRICNNCDVREQCLEYALKEQIELGIWGGTNEEERKRLRNKRLAVRHTA